MQELTPRGPAAEILGLDARVLVWIDTWSSSWLDVAALNVTQLGSSVVAVLVAVVAGTLLWLLGRAGEAAILGTAVGGASVITPLLKNLFDRPRPEGILDGPAVYVGSPGFPSGHATMGTVLMVALAVVIHRLAAGQRWVSIVATATAAVLVLLIGLSRLYLGVHYPTDVLAGFAVGSGWAAFAVFWFGRTRERREGASGGRSGHQEE